MENDFAIVIQDIHPKAPIHYLIIPKKHIANIATLADADREFGWNLLVMARDISKKFCNGNGFNLIANNGADAGQSVFHLHIHFLSGKNMAEGDFKL